VARRRQRWSWRYADITGVRSPPLRGGASLGRMALRRKARGWRGGGFLGGARSPRPDCKAVRTPRHFISTTCVDDEPVAKRRQRWSWRCAVVTGVRSPPLRGGASLGRMALRRKARGWRGGGFLGGARSPRPDCKAVRTPRHFISTTCVDDDPVAKGRQRWGWPYADVMGVQSPPLRGVGYPS
jgi:hypothetical protein